MTINTARGYVARNIHGGSYLGRNYSTEGISFVPWVYAIVYQTAAQAAETADTLSAKAEIVPVYATGAFGALAEPKGGE